MAVLQFVPVLHWWKMTDSAATAVAVVHHQCKGGFRTVSAAATVCGTASVAEGSLIAAKKMS